VEQTKPDPVVSVVPENQQSGRRSPIVLEDHAVLFRLRQE